MTSSPPRASTLRRLASEGLAVREPYASAEGIDRARRALVEGAEAVPAHGLPGAGLTALALGWFQGARRFLQRGLESSETSTAGAPLLILAAQYGLWTSDVRTLSELAPHLDSHVARVRREGPTSVLRDLARAVEPGGDSPALTALRERGGQEPSKGSHAVSWRDVAGLLAPAFDSAPDALTRPTTLAALVEDGTFQPPTLPLGPLALVRGLLGGEADAGYGRLRLGPRLPRTWTHLAMDGLCMGDTAMALDYRAESGHHRFRLRQTRGRVPLNLVFEPEVPWPDSAGAAQEGRPLPRGLRLRVRLNDQTTDAETMAAGPRVRVRMQVPLDRETEIVVDGGGE